ncbi:MAG: DNA mismatch repair endonuclease MutL [Desulfovibrionaceae bacterium]|nr:DNA mismatch repair endonuclease MutL [Desulfovibrionaceae bacterium]
MSKEMRHIQVLSVALRNQIAAGEVVERPAAALKELMENSLDAAAKQIDVEIENGGQALIRVQDDGVGIAKDELALALTRHATSKISQQKDLEQINTLGFRGEALPSIAEVSKLRLLSAQGDAAFELDVDFGVHRELKQCALPRGTVVEVRDLFGNIPARLRFLKSPATEQKHAQDILMRLALAHLNVGFSLKLGGREVLRIAANQNLATRLAQFWPQDIAQSLLPFCFERNGVKVHGLTSPPQVTQLRNNRILLYVNGRSITDKRILGAIREAYQGKLTSRDYPQVVLFLEIDPSLVDVNVHPTKAEVRFQNESLIFVSCVQALSAALEKSSAVTAPTSEPKTSPSNLVEKPGPDFTPRPPGFWGSLDEPSFPKPKDDNVLDADTGPWQVSVAQRESASTPTQREPGVAMQNLIYLGQIAATYLLFRDTNNDLLVVDQHAAHERVLYARLLANANKHVGQGLMVPFELQLHPTEWERFQELSSVLAQMGFELSREQGTLTCSAIPPLLDVAFAKTFLRDALNGALNDNSDMLKSMACHAAIKAGQVLSCAEVTKLLGEWLATPDHEFCPHGRPVVLRYDAHVLEHAFKRKQ